ncbi:sensor histidine kinase [Evansella halocellulosilytica]|uniref:sensor histidine kinase n=1 Tax=Evansella halocellulosilytica TaxID=2011013 RepID=UPI000BB9452E|nr:histidine kinase [Evansella halocellulosilytica]
MKIRKKLTLFFFILIIFMSGITVFIYQSSQKSLNQYDEILQKFLIMNEISQLNNELNASFTNYLLVPSAENLQQFEDDKKEMYLYQEEFADVIAPENDVSMSKNYYHMMAYLVYTMELAIDTYEENAGHEHFRHREEVEKLSLWINETTLKFIHNELEDYHEFNHEMLLQSQYNLSIALMSAIFILIGSLVFAFLFYKRITDPIRVLVGQAEELSAGNFEIHDAPVTNDEVGVLARTFNQMKENIHQLIIEMKHRSALETKLKEQTIKNIETERLLKEMELRSLQNQMNPHFLFNTLNTVSKMAYIEGAEKSSDLIVSISSLLRYNLQSIDKPVTLEDEMNHVKDYIMIQQSRFGDRVIFDITNDSIHLDLPIPLLTLQPLVENAYIHGIGPLENGGEITITVTDTSSNVIVEVKDNGVGMNNETLKQLSDITTGEGETKADGHTTGIGLSNVYQRAVLFYGKKDVMTIQSRLGEGTKVTLTLPKNCPEQ